MRRPRRRLALWLISARPDYSHSIPKGLEIAGNHLHDIGNNAIQVWTSDRREDGTLIIGNRIERVAANDGGDGQNGNGINIFRGSGVTVANNRITDCAFSAVRDNSGDNITIVNNNCARITETAIFVEFAFSGAVVTGNMLESVSAGISITNYNEGGRLAVCANNVVRDVKGGGPNPNGRAVGIGVEADTVVNANVIENSAEIGLGHRLGPLSAQHQCRRQYHPQLSDRHRRLSGRRARNRRSSPTI